MKYLLIDGNNLAVRNAFANAELKNQNGIPTGVHYGVFQSLILLKKEFPQHQFLVVWDGKSIRRVAEAKVGVEKGIVPSGYKENRAKGDDLPQELKDFYSQADFLQRGIGQAGIPQIRLNDFEADDVIASYAKLLKANNEVTVVTSDKDYWQILDDNVVLWDGMKQIKTTKSSWEKEYGLKTVKAIDIGALTGDSGDNIFGIPGWGDKTAIKELQKHGSWEGVLKAYHDKYDKLRDQYPDIKDWQDSEDSGIDFEKVKQEEFYQLRTAKCDPNKPTSRLKFPEISFDMPFTGVCYAFHKGEVKISKAELMALMFEERVKLAYSLKKMDDEIPDLPMIEPEPCDPYKLREYFEYYDIYTLQDDMGVFGKVEKKELIEVEDEELEDFLVS